MIKVNCLELIFIVLQKCSAMARFLFFLRFARRHRLQATLLLLRSAKRHLSLVSTPASQGRKDKAMVRLLRRLRVPLDTGGYDEHGLLTVEQIE